LWENVLKCPTYQQCDIKIGVQTMREKGNYENSLPMFLMTPFSSLNGNLSTYFPLTYTIANVSLAN